VAIVVMAIRFGSYFTNLALYIVAKSQVYEVFIMGDVLIFAIRV